MTKMLGCFCSCFAISFSFQFLRLQTFKLFNRFAPFNVTLSLIPLLHPPPRQPEANPSFGGRDGGKSSGLKKFERIEQR
jgi:hypothetical protein